MGQADRPAPIQLLLLGSAVISGALASDHLWRVYRRLAYPYDLNFWSEDFFMTSMIKLHAGQALYGPVADANSTVYAPGQALLHYALLAPFGLAVSVVANKLLGHCFALLAVALGTMLGLRLLRDSGLPKLLLSAVLAPALLACLYMNPVIDGLHPGNLEACLFAGCALGCSALPRLTPNRRRALLLLLPVAALLLKQNSGVVMLAALGLVTLTTQSGAARRVDLLALAASAFVAALLLQLTGGRHFWQWGVVLLSEHPFEWQRIRGFSTGLGPLFAPVFVVIVARTVIALRRRSRADQEFLRAALPALLYVPVAILAQLKTRGGANNTASLGFVLALVALPVLLGVIAMEKRRLLVALAAGTLGFQTLAWRSQRYVPDAQDFALAETACAYAAKRLHCGEQVWLGRGSVCYAREAGQVPKDRMPSVRDVVASGRFAELGLLERLERGAYNVILLHEADMRFLGPVFWKQLNAHYRLFHAGQEHVAGDYWLNGFQGWGSRRVLYFERIVDAGRHSLNPDQGCEGASR